MKMIHGCIDFGHQKPGGNIRSGGGVIHLEIEDEDLAQELIDQLLIVKSFVV